jgi:CDP-diacylglycerol--glycerol-3-phosphate 3-phosphatidyltransferase
MNLANLLSSTRLALVPVLLLLAWSGQARIFFITLIVSLITDALDGWVARRWNQATEFGARLDSWADLLTSLSLPFAGWCLRPDIMKQESAFLLTGLAFYIAALLAGWLKFWRLTSYHTWAAKTAAVGIAIAVVIVFAGGPGWPLRIVIPLVVAACTEEIAITMILDQWRPNVPTIFHARKLSAGK